MVLHFLSAQSNSLCTRIVNELQVNKSKAVKSCDRKLEKDAEGGKAVVMVVEKTARPVLFAFPNIKKMLLM